MARKHAKKKSRIPVVFIVALIAVVTVLAVKLGAKAGQKSGSALKNTAQAGNYASQGMVSEGNTGADLASASGSEDTADPEDPEGGEGSGSTAQDTVQAAIARAAGMQDYSIDPSTGRAADISEVDDNYLLLVNRTHALTDTYAPDDMVTVTHSVSGVGIKGETDQLRRVAAEAFEAMVEAAENDNIQIKMRTGYRSYAYQRDRLYNSYVKKYGQAYADTISARPGQSEHQTGLALDIGGASEGYALSRNFGNTKEGKWVAEHCHEFGFIIRYTDGTKDSPGPTTGFISEPWHIRYVGVEPAGAIYQSGVLLEEFLGVLY